VDPIAEKRAAARRLIVHQGDDDKVAQVYAVRRIRAEDLQAQGMGEILGPEALDRARAAEQKRTDALGLLEQAGTAEDRARIQGDIDAMTAARNEDVLSALVSSEERVRGLLGRCEAYLVAAVEGFGIVLDDSVPHGILARGVSPDTVCRDLGDGLRIRKGRFVLGPDAKDGEIPLSEIPVAERVALGLLVMSALEVASTVATFPAGPGAPRAR
jgi:hypothetical protein